MRASAEALAAVDGDAGVCAGWVKADSDMAGSVREFAQAVTGARSMPIQYRL